MQRNHVVFATALALVSIFLLFSWLGLLGGPIRSESTNWQRTLYRSENFQNSEDPSVRRPFVRATAVAALSDSFIIEDSFPSTPFQVAQLPRLNDRVAEICSQDSEGCLLYEQFMRVLSQQATFASNGARLHVILLDPLVWLRNVDEVVYHNVVQDIADEIRMSRDHIRFRGSDFLLVCLAHYCQRFAEEFAPILSNDKGSRAIFAGVDIDVHRVKWPCPLRLIKIDAKKLGDLSQLSEELIHLASIMIHRSNRWICYDKKHPASYFGNHNKDMVASGMWIEEHNLLMCGVPKCGSSITTMLVRRLLHKEDWRVFNKDLPHNPKKNGVIYIKRDIDYDRTKRIFDDPHIIKAVIVRHPIPRLLSGYKNKIVDDSGYWRVKDLGAYVREHGVPTFPQFVDFLIDNNPDPYNVEHHFRSQSWHCGMQNHSMDFVGHLEDLGPDFEEFAKSVGIWDDYASSGWGKDHSLAFGVKADGRENSDDRLWGQYTTEMMNKVYQYYKDDFPRFGFSLQEILDKKPADRP